MLWMAWRMVCVLRVREIRLSGLRLRGWLDFVVVRDGGLGAVRPSDLFGGPVLIVVIDICPVVLSLGFVVLLKTCRNVDSIFL